jgi:uncharacterized protein (DUF1499 family)
MADDTNNETGMTHETEMVGETNEHVVATEAEAEPEAPKASRNISGKMVFGAGLGSILLALAGGLGKGFGLWDLKTGFLMLAVSLGLAAFAVLFGFGIGRRQKKTGTKTPKTMRWIGMLFGLGMMGWLLSFVITARTVPAIHDISTDLADPPQFAKLSVRADNFDQIPGEGDSDMKGMSPQQRWVMIHQKEYGDIRSVRVNESVEGVIAKAERIAEARGWKVAIADPIEGRMEATETTRFFSFKDDVVLRVRATEDQTGSIVDMRSISREGVSDLGVNAKRVRAFLADLSGTVSTR